MGNGWRQQDSSRDENNYGFISYDGDYSSEQFAGVGEKDSNDSPRWGKMTHLIANCIISGQWMLISWSIGSSGICTWRWLFIEWVSQDKGEDWSQQATLLVLRFCDDLGYESDE
jgi:hypothetical protein